ncbi:hypothetical protein [Pseudoponticoccus marisrubri]|uniref:Clp protease n=1 Tax=Pseudoponticoccus marisrubri TaxID=1685382 RepID=A0A0W7WKN1_9RHOB|nr:hypothetical protein [Pseudoponticoccus marisrubri]KUF11171.1 hypothetical protein AVJ23_08950 [Pseudoponticoccus marisrubri]
MWRMILVAALSLAAPAASEEDGAGREKFRLEGPVLVYDTEAAEDEREREIRNADLDILIALLRDTPGITTLKLNSSGGSVLAGQEMARVVMDFELDTIVDGECSSSCVTVFLGGARRQLTRGGKLGFHQLSWSPGAIESYYETWREEHGWQTPFDFASWVYKDTQTEVHKELRFMIARGVDPDFAIETKRLRSGTWFPPRATLLDAGVLTE